MEKNPKLNSLPKSIKTLEDVSEFFDYLHNVEKVLFHPEFDFDSYVDKENKPTYTKQQIKERNKLMDQCYEVCAENGIDICSIGVESQKRNLSNDNSLESEKN